MIKKLFFYFFKQNNKEKNILYFYFAFFTLVLLLIFITAEYSRDIESYRILYNHIEFYNSFEVINDKFYYEYLFLFCFYFLSLIFNFNELFFLIGFLTLYLKLNIFWKNYNYFFYACLMYVFLQLLSMHEASQLRTSLVMVFILYAISNSNNNIIFNSLIAIIASMFHKIGIIYLALISFKYFLLASAMLIFSYFFIEYIIFSLYEIYDLTEYLPLDVYAEFNAIKNSQNPASLTNSLFWSQVIISILSLLNFKSLEIQQKKSIYLIILCVFTYILFLNVPNISSRMVEISLIGLIPLFCSSKIKWNLLWYGKSFFLSYIIIYQTTLYVELFYSNVSK